MKRSSKIIIAAVTAAVTFASLTVALGPKDWTYYHHGYHHHGWYHHHEDPGATFPETAPEDPGQGS